MRKDSANYRRAHLTQLSKQVQEIIKKKKNQKRTEEQIFNPNSIALVRKFAE